MDSNHIINIEALARITKASEPIKIIMKHVCEEYGIYAVLENKDKLCVDNKNAYLLEHIKNLLMHNNMLEAIVALTEISSKELIKYNLKDDADILVLLNEPHRLDLDTRKLEALRQVKIFYDSYMQYVKEIHKKIEFLQ